MKNLTRFSLKLLEGKQQKINFDDSERKVQELDFRLDALK